MVAPLTVTEALVLEDLATHGSTNPHTAHSPTLRGGTTSLGPGTADGRLPFPHNSRTSGLAPVDEWGKGPLPGPSLVYPRRSRPFSPVFPSTVV